LWVNRSVADVIRNFGVEPAYTPNRPFDTVIIAVAHGQFRKILASAIRTLVKEYPVPVDVQGVLAQDHAPLMEGSYRKLLFPSGFLSDFLLPFSSRHLIIHSRKNYHFLHYFFFCSQEII